MRTDEEARVDARARISDYVVARRPNEGACLAAERLEDRPGADRVLGAVHLVGGPVRVDRPSGPGTFLHVRVKWRIPPARGRL